MQLHLWTTILQTKKKRIERTKLKGKETKMERIAKKDNRLLRNISISIRIILAKMSSPKQLLNTIQLTILKRIISIMWILMNFCLKKKQNTIELRQISMTTQSARNWVSMRKNLIFKLEIKGFYSPRNQLEKSKDN